MYCIVFRQRFSVTCAPSGSFCSLKQSPRQVARLCLGPNASIYVRVLPLHGMNYDIIVLSNSPGEPFENIPHFFPVDTRPASQDLTKTDGLFFISRINAGQAIC